MIEIYTDGACKGNPGPGGYAFKILIPGGITVSRAYGVLDTTNNRMELNAVITALKTLIDLGHTVNTKCHIYTDSAYVANPFTKDWLTKWVNTNFKGIKNIDLWKQMLELSKYFELEFELVKGHSGVLGNEDVDKMAQNACYKQGLVESSVIKLIEK